PNIIITLFWIVGITSATNSLDNCDGVASGVTAIASFFIFVIAWGSSTDDAQPWLSYLAIGMAGSCLGFLRYNFPPARIYLGDNGSFFLGYMLASMLVFAHYSENPLKAILVPCLVLAVPIFDITLSTLLRIRDGDVRSWKEAVLYCGRDHMAHLLMRVGFSKKRTVAVIYSLAVGGGVAALLVMANDKFSVCFAIAGMYGVLLVAVGILLGRVRQKLGNPLLKRKTGVTA
ncbi:MAG: MraY family glycosyltransferase, partial [Planctomycetota bacterium]